jgi:hypothetical protein
MGKVTPIQRSLWSGADHQAEFCSRPSVPARQFLAQTQHTAARPGAPPDWAPIKPAASRSLPREKGDNVYNQKMLIMFFTTICLCFRRYTKLIEAKPSGR